MDFSRGVQQKDFEIQGPWVPVTPAKPIPTKRPPISGLNWLESVDVSAIRNGNSGGSWGLSNGCQAVALPSASQQAQAHSHNDGLQRLVFNNSTEGWAQMPYRSLLAISDATVTNKMTSLAPFMLAQIGGGSSQEMSASPNQLRLNGKVLLTSSLCNSNNRPPAMTHRSQYGFPIPFLPNLNSLPENNMTSTVVSAVMPSPSTPVTLEKNKWLEDRPPPEIIDLVDERPTYRNIEQNKFGALQQPIPEKPTDQCFSNPVMSSQIVSSQQQEGEMNVVISSEEQLDIEKHAERENQGIDLNKTPPQKPKRKKHRPKVIREGKSAKTPKPVTPKPVNPKPPRKAENPTGKRKYERKKKDLNISETPSNVLGEIVDPDSRSGTNSVRRSLNFDTEDSQVRNGCLGSAMMFTHNTSETQDREACTAAAIIASSSTKSAVHSAQGQGVVVSENSLGAGIAFDLNSSTNQFANEYAGVPETPNPPPQPSRREMMRMNLMQDEYIKMLNNPTPLPQPCRREPENLKEPARKNDCLNIAGNHKTSMEAGQNQVDSNKISDVLLKGTKRDHSLVDDAQISAHTSFMRAYNRTGRVSESHDASRHGPCFPEIHKKKRTENGQNELTSNASSTFTYTPSSGWKTIQVVQNASEAFTFADAQRLMALEKMRASERMLVFDQVERTINKRSVQADSPTSLSAAVDCHMSTPVKPCEHNNTSCNKLSTPEKPSGCNNNSQESEICGSQAQREEVKPKTRRRTKKKRVHLDNLMSSNSNQMEHDAASCNTGSSPVCINPSASRNSKEQNAHLRITSIQDCQSRCNRKGSVRASFHSGTVVSYRDPVDDIVHKLKHLNINGGHKDVTPQVQNALVPYGGGGGVMVPFEGPFDLTKKRRPRAKVDLDPESNRVWKLLMGKESSEGDGGMEMDKEKWWEEERRVFCGRADSFIARMHLVQGDRRFSQWKGSVVDSVIGVFLTQNVSDHLSSSAFMALAARFPLRSRDNNTTRNAEQIIRPIEQQDECIITFDDTIRWPVKMSDQELSDRSPLPIRETEHMDEKEMANSNESIESNTVGEIVDYSKGKSSDFHERGLGIGHESPDSGSGTAVTFTSCTSVAEGEDRRSLEDVVSSQNSVVSSQDSSEYLVQAAEQSKLSSLLNFEADDLLTGGMGNGFNSFTELLKMANSRGLQELNSPGNGRISSMEYGGGINQLSHQGIDKRPSVPNQSDYLNCAGPSIYTSNSHPHPTQHDFTSLSCAPSPSHYYQNSSNSRLVGMENADVVREESSRSHLPPSACEINKTNVIEIMGAVNSAKAMDQHKLLASKIAPPANTFAPISKNSVQPKPSSGTEVRVEKHSSCQNNLPKGTAEASSEKNISCICSYSQAENTAIFKQKEREAESHAENTPHTVEAQAPIQNCRTPQTCSNSHNNNNQRNTLEVVEAVESNLRNEACTSQKVLAETLNNASKAKKVKAETEKKKTYDWDTLRKQASHNGAKKERSSATMDSLDYEAVRCADVSEISHTIRERGMNNMLAERIKEFLNRLVRDHGSIDLEWLRDVPPDKAKDYLLSIRGLGLKSVECVRLLTLHHLAFPVDTNVGRICVRLGWVPLQPLPESLQLHLLEMYPVLETIQKYLWPRLCKLDQRTLYELHYQMITFGKVFCTKSKPNCNACPMRGECKHFASAFASARLALPGPEEKSLVSSTIPIASERGRPPVFKPMPLPQLEGNTLSQDRTVPRNCEPIIEEPATPEPECIETSESAIEDAFYDDPDEIPTIKLNLEEFTQNLQNYMQENNMELQDGDMSKALVAITPEVASIPMPKLKNVSRLRTEHQVYELPDSHPLLEGLDQREPDDPSPYLLAIWTPGETAQSTEPPQVCCNSQDMGKLCDKNTCFSCNSIREAQAQMVRGTLLIPCRTAMRGSFPLNGTYFQVNEVFADHDSSRNPIDVPRDWIWSLPRRTVYFGTSIPTIFKGLTTEGIQHCFWRGFVCVRGFDRTIRAPRPLYARLHFPASKSTRNKKAAAAAVAAAAAAAAGKEE